MKKIVVAGGCLALALGCAGVTEENGLPAPMDTKALLSAYVGRFNATDDECYTNAIPNAQAESFMLANCPHFACPDKDIERTYYFRWWTFRKHLRHDLGHWTVTEFLPKVGWSGKGNTIVCPAGHHLREGRWLRDPKYIEENARFWLTDPEATHRWLYSSWLFTGVCGVAEVTGHDALPAELIDGAVAYYRRWEQGFERGGWPHAKTARMGGDGKGGFLSVDNHEGTEISLGGNGYKPLFSSAMASEAAFIAKVAKAAGREALAAEFAAKAETARQSLLAHCWNADVGFFTTEATNGVKSAVRELHGYAPWYFGLATDGRRPDWTQLADPQGFAAPFGLTFPERRAKGFTIDYRGHECKWNGPSWPFATSVALTALINDLHAQSNNRTIEQSNNLFTSVIRQYAAAQKLQRARGPGGNYEVVPWIDENLHPDTGEWISRRIILDTEKMRTSFPRERGKDYNHSTFCDLVISGLVGFVPNGAKGFTVDPLFPATWDYLVLENLRYRGHDVGIRWRRGRGLEVTVDGGSAARRTALGRIVVDFERTGTPNRGLQAAIDRCAAAGGGVVTAEPGRTTMAGVLTLRSNVTLKLRDDSEIFFPDDPALYGRTPSLVYAEGATNVAIVGKGVIRAQGERWHREIYLAKGWRPRFFQFRRCEGVRLEDFHVRGSPMWTLHMLMSRKIVLRGLDVFVRGGNTDGVDIDSSQDVLIENCRLDQGDDGFVMKSGKNEEGRLRAMPTKNVTIRNCTVVNAHTLLGIGSELSGGVEDVHLENCTVEGKVWKVLYVKSSRARGGWVRNISVRNVTCERAKVCVFGIRTDYADTSYSAESTDRSFLTPMENITMENVTVDHGWRMCEIDGFEELPPKGVVLRNVTLKHATRGESEIRNAGDLRLENVTADMGPFSVWCDEPDAKYDCGETAVFTVVAHTNAGVATVRLDNFGKGVIEEQTVDFAKTPRLELKGTRDIPGFLLLTVRLGKETKRCGASFGRRQIAGGAEKPADFEAFWREAIAKYDREVPVDVKLERSGLLSTNGCDVFRVELSDPFGRTVNGYLKEPKDISKGPFPVLVNIPGAGPCIGAPTWERADCVELVMNVRDEAILAVNRAVDWLRTRPEADPDRFLCRGGVQALALMALNGGFRRGVVLAPTLACGADHFGGVNFASMIRHPILFTASYTDTVAPPHAAYAAYNACPAKEKYIMDVVGFGHEGSRVESGEAKRWLMNEDHEYAIPIANMTCPWSPWK